MENEESLKTSALIGELADTVQHQINDFLANSVVATGIVISGIFLASNQLLRVKQGSVSASANLINDGWFQVDKDSTRDVLARTCIYKKITNSILKNLSC